jgi:hypothetical protein
MPNPRPSFLKRQKEQARKAKAEQKREARLARRSAPPDDADAPDIATPTEIEDLGAAKSEPPTL